MDFGAGSLTGDTVEAKADGNGDKGGARHDIGCHAGVWWSWSCNQSGLLSLSTNQ